ncbi:MAG: protein-L-isoaspartate(D-aspartate) O-methyltransferase [Planctomycetota bacterium]|jgi:protein-L-isoaspartate(D-aspartate) O-methyltransferase
MVDEEAKLAAARQKMVSAQLKARGIHHERVLQAFENVPRDRFLPPHRKHEAYADRAVPIGCGQTISQPYVVALMLQELDPNADHRVLDIGAGSGYQTALLGRLVRKVFAVERIAELTERAEGILKEIGVSNVTLRTGDGTLGWDAEAPFDRIICGAAAPHIPEPWIEQLIDGGRIVVPLGGVEAQTIVVAEKIGNTIRRREVCDVRFVKLIGREAWPEEQAS